nr:hypothetical protein [Microbacterium proteolyticum]
MTELIRAARAVGVTPGEMYASIFGADDEATYGVEANAVAQ